MLEKSEERYRLLVDTMTHGVQENDCKGTITLSNRAHHMILGCEEGELLGKKIWDFLPSSADQEELKKYLAFLVKDQPPPSPYQTTCMRKDGSSVDLQIDWNYVRDAKGVLTGFISIITDITERKKFEIYLHNRTQGFTLLLEASKNLTATLDLQNVLQMSVESVTKLVGLDTAAVYLIDGDMLRLRATTPPLPPDFTDEMRVAPLADHPHIQKAIISAKPIFVTDYLAEDLTSAERDIAQNRNLRSLLFVPLVSDEKALGIFIVGSIGKPSILSDVEIDLSLTLGSLAALAVKNSQLYEEIKENTAELEQALSERINAEKAQRLSEGRYSALFEYSNIGMVIADQESFLIDANPCTSKLLGYTRQEMIGVHASKFVSQTEIQHIEPALNHRKTKRGDNRAWQFRRKDGSVFEADVTATELPDGNLLWIIRDLTDQRRTEKERADLEAQLQQAQKMESIGRLAGGVAHDFNNMLSVILGYLDLTLLNVDKNKSLHIDLMQIREAAQRSANLTRQLLAFARRQIATPEVLDLNGVIGDMLKILRRLIGENIDLAWLPGPNLGLVKIDPSQVDQILANLCVNARDAISGTGKITIETSNAQFDQVYCDNHPGFFPGEYIMLAVRDDGAGMDQKMLANIFEPYFSTKKAGEGTGLGLSTVYGIVRQNKGFINVYSEIGKGTTFKIYLCRQKTSVDSAPKTIMDRTAQGGSETILLVEDERMILELCEIMLKSLGYRVLIANKPTDALRIAKEQTEKIDLLISDVVMPEMNGLELAKKLKTIIPQLKVLYLSGYTANVVAHHGLLYDGILLLTKPFSLMELASKVREAITWKEPSQPLH